MEVGKSEDLSPAVRGSSNTKPAFFPTPDKDEFDYVPDRAYWRGDLDIYILTSS